MNTTFTCRQRCLLPAKPPRHTTGPQKASTAVRLRDTTVACCTSCLRLPFCMLALCSSRGRWAAGIVVTVARVIVRTVSLCGHPRPPSNRVITSHSLLAWLQRAWIQRDLELLLPSIFVVRGLVLPVIFTLPSLPRDKSAGPMSSTTRRLPACSCHPLTAVCAICQKNMLACCTFSL
jgi:hypothetical protein